MAINSSESINDYYFPSLMEYIIFGIVLIVLFGPIGTIAKNVFYHTKEAETIPIDMFGHIHDPKLRAELKKNRDEYDAEADKIFDKYDPIIAKEVKHEYCYGDSPELPCDKCYVHVPSFYSREYYLDRLKVKYIAIEAEIISKHDAGILRENPVRTCRGKTPPKSRAETALESLAKTLPKGRARTPTKSR